jgi:hypothetical protein
MDTTTRRAGLKKIGVVALLTLAIGLVAAVPSQARDGGGHGSAGGHRGAVEEHHRFEGHHDFDRDHHARGFIGVRPWVVYPYAWSYPPAYTYSEPQTDAYSEPQAVYYYCQSAGAYYPDVQTCPEAWVPVAAQ